MKSTLCRTYFKCIRRDLDSTFALGLRQFRYHDGIIGKVSFQRNNQLVCQNVVMATLISPLHYHSLGTGTVSSQDISKYLDIAILAFWLVHWISVASHYKYTSVGLIWKWMRWMSLGINFCYVDKKMNEKRQIQWAICRGSTGNYE